MIIPSLNWPKSRRWTAHVIVAFALASILSLQAIATDTSPGALLAESWELAKNRVDHGDVRTMAALRIGETMRMAGMKDAAVAAFDECLALVAQGGDADNRDEAKIELAREFLLLGLPERAHGLARELKVREFDLAGQCILARTALELGDAAEAERAVREALALARTPGRKTDRMGRAMLCALGRAAVELKQPGLARECEDAIADAVWKSALTGDRAASMAGSGNLGEALRIAAQAADEHMAVLAHARVMAALIKRGIAAEQISSALMAVAAKMKETDKREFALRIAAGVVAAAGDVKSAAKIAAEIQSPTTRLLAMGPFVEAASFNDLMSLLSQSAAADQSALAEMLAVGCGKRGLAGQALTVAAKVTQGWPRVRALCDAAKGPGKEGATKLLAAAVDELSRVPDAGWRCIARSRVALAAHRGGDAKLADEQIAAARGEAMRIESADDYRAVLPQVIEAALDCGGKELAATTLGDALKRKPVPALRDVLVPMLIEAGQPDAALAETAAASLENDFARRFVAYRLARAGRVADAVTFAGKFNSRLRAEALCDIARAQLPAVPPRHVPFRRVGLSLHGGWMSWTPRLERMGLPWEVMPLSTPYEEGAAGLAARYTMLGFPGAGDHHIQCSAAGIEHVRGFLRDGGGLFGICAGQLFAIGHPYGHRFVPADFYYLRGGGPHEVQMAAGQPAGAGLPSQIIIVRRNGDFMLPRPGCDVIGWYDNENICAAVIAARYGLGRVVVSSPHPEGDNSFSPTDRLCIELTRWILEDTP
jgi:hypothetical protein